MFAIHFPWYVSVGLRLGNQILELPWFWNVNWVCSVVWRSLVSYGLQGIPGGEKCLYPLNNGCQNFYINLPSHQTTEMWIIWTPLYHLEPDWLWVRLIHMWFLDATVMQRLDWCTALIKHTLAIEEYNIIGLEDFRCWVIQYLHFTDGINEAQTRNNLRTSLRMRLTHLPKPVHNPSKRFYFFILATPSTIKVLNTSGFVDG